MNQVGLINFINTLEYYKEQTSSRTVAKKLGMVLSQIDQCPVTVEDLVMYIGSVPKFLDIDEGDEYADSVKNAVVNTGDSNFYHAVSYALIGRHTKECIFEPVLGLNPIISAGELINIKNHFSINSFYEKIDELDDDALVFSDQFIDYSEIGVGIRSHLVDEISFMIFSKVIYSLYLILKEVEREYTDASAVTYFRFMRSSGGRFAIPFCGYEQIITSLVDAQIKGLPDKQRDLINYDLLSSYVRRFMKGFQTYLSDTKTGFFGRRLKAYGGMLHYFRS